MEIRWMIYNLDVYLHHEEEDDAVERRKSLEQT